jgi:hypothetical protein
MCCFIIQTVFVFLPLTIRLPGPLKKEAIRMLILTTHRGPTGLLPACNACAKQDMNLGTGSPQHEAALLIHFTTRVRKREAQLDHKASERGNPHVDADNTS